MESKEYRRIAETYLDDVYRAVFCCCGNRENAEDAVQNAFLKLLRENEFKFNDDEHIKRWLITVALNECKNVWKSFWNRNKVSFDDLDTEPSYHDNIHEIHNECGSAYKDISEELIEALDKLPKNYRAVIHLYYYEEYSVKEIAAILGISESNVQVRLKRARDKMKVLIGEE